MENISFPGFLSTGDAACPGNNGLKDQVAALRWVRDNIAAFDGNSSRVTICGGGADGANVQYHVLSPASRGRNFYIQMCNKILVVRT
jgi:carboxylesterase type B